MSCMVMKKEPLAALANAVETRLNIGYDYWGFETPSSLYRELADCKTSCTYFAEPIYRKLYAVNIRAYNGRYSSHEEPADEQVPDVDISRYTITRRPEYREHGFAVCRWHYQLAMLLDFWLYQTAEDATYKDPLRLAMAEFRDDLYKFIVANSPGYYNGRWGELPRQTSQAVKTGYNRSKEVEPLILEPEDWQPNEWATLCKLAGHLTPQDTDRIVIRDYTLETYITKKEADWVAEDIKESSCNDGDDRTYTVTEVCPHCESEIEMRWDTDTQGFKAFCPVCGKRLMLCDECLHMEGGKDCDYDNVSDTCHMNPPGNQPLDSAEESEYDYILAYIREGSFEELEEIDRLRAIWTAYCLRKGLTVDSDTYTARLLRLWQSLQENGTSEFNEDDHERFEYIMGGLL